MTLQGCSEGDGNTGLPFASSTLFCEMYTFLSDKLAEYSHLILFYVLEWSVATDKLFLYAHIQKLQRVQYGR